MSGLHLTPRPLTREAFVAFGDVVEASAAPRVINEGNTQRFHDLADLDCTRAGGKAIVSIFRTSPLRYPLTLRTMENHPLSSQLFMPLKGRPYLVAVAPRGALAPSAIEVFRAAPQQGVNIHAGVWHHFNLALEAESDFLVIDREGTDNLEEQALAEEVVIVLEPA